MTAIPTHYVVRCPDCHGRMFSGSALCSTCHGDGRLLIPEAPQYRATAKRAKIIALLAAVVILIIVAIVVNR